jgi:hypothetical protein
LPPGRLPCLDHPKRLTDGKRGSAQGLGDFFPAETGALFANLQGLHMLPYLVTQRPHSEAPHLAQSPLKLSLDTALPQVPQGGSFAIFFHNNQADRPSVDRVPANGNRRP